MNRNVVTMMVWLLCLALSTSVQAQRLEIQESLSFQIADVDCPADESRIHGVAIDQTIYAEWDEMALSRQLGIITDLVSRDDPLLQRVQFLEDVTAYFMRAHELLMELKAAGSRLEAAKLAGRGSATLEELRALQLSASTRFEDEAISGLTRIAGAESELNAVEDRILAAELIDKVNQAILIDYEEVARVTGKFLAVQLDELNKRAQSLGAKGLLTVSLGDSAGSLDDLTIESVRSAAAKFLSLGQVKEMARSMDATMASS